MLEVYTKLVNLPYVTFKMIFLMIIKKLPKIKPHSLCNCTKYIPKILAKLINSVLKKV